MKGETIAAFVVAAGALTMVPGADTLLIVRRTLRDGRVAGWWTNLGVCSGLAVHATAVGLALRATVWISPGGLEFLRWAGASYLLYLAAGSFRAGFRAVGGGSDPTSSPENRFRRRGAFLQGLLSNTLNPKTLLFYMAFLPVFLGPEDPPFSSWYRLAGIHAALALGWQGVLVAAVARSSRWIGRSAVHRWFELAAGVVFLGLAVELARRG